MEGHLKFRLQFLKNENGFFAGIALATYFLRIAITTNIPAGGRGKRAFKDNIIEDLATPALQGLSAVDSQKTVNFGSFLVPGRLFSG